MCMTIVCPWIEDVWQKSPCNLRSSIFDPDVFYFYEVYTNAEDLDHHRETSHYKKYDAASQNLIAERSIQRCALEAINL